MACHAVLRCATTVKVVLPSGAQTHTHTHIHTMPCHTIIKTAAHSTPLSSGLLSFVRTHAHPALGPYSSRSLLKRFGPLAARRRSRPRLFIIGSPCGGVARGCSREVRRAPICLCTPRGTTHHSRSSPPQGGPYSLPELGRRRGARTESRSDCRPGPAVVGQGRAGHDSGAGASERSV